MLKFDILNQPPTDSAIRAEIAKLEHVCCIAAIIILVTSMIAYSSRIDIAFFLFLFLFLALFVTARVLCRALKSLSCLQQIGSPLQYQAMEVMEKQSRYVKEYRARVRGIRTTDFLVGELEECRTFLSKVTVRYGKNL